MTLQRPYLLEPHLALSVREGAHFVNGELVALTKKVFHCAVSEVSRTDGPPYCLAGSRGYPPPNGRMLRAKPPAQGWNELYENCQEPDLNW